VKRRTLVLALAAVVLAAGCTDRLEGSSGEDLYRAGCAACHGGDLSGGIGPTLGPGSNADLGLSDNQLEGVIRVGPGSMPPFDERLTSSQINSLVKYLRSQQRGSEGE